MCSYAYAYLFTIITKVLHLLLMYNASCYEINICDLVWQNQSYCPANFELILMFKNLIFCLNTEQHPQNKWYVP